MFPDSSWKEQEPISWWCPLPSVLSMAPCGPRPLSKVSAILRRKPALTTTQRVSWGRKSEEMHWEEDRDLPGGGLGDGSQQWTQEQPQSRCLHGPAGQATAAATPPQRSHHTRLPATRPSPRAVLLPQPHVLRKPLDPRANSDDSRHLCPVGLSQNLASGPQGA